MTARSLVALVSLGLALPGFAASGCKSSGSDTTTTGGPTAAPIAAEQFCKELATIVCDADARCCDGAIDLTLPLPDPSGAGGAGGAGGSGGAAGGASVGGGAPGTGGTAGAPAAPESCLSRQVAACDATAGKLVQDPRTGYDPARGGELLAAITAEAKECWSKPIAYGAFLAQLPGTGALSADCTPDDLSPASLRLASASCKQGTACRISLRADGQARGTCEARDDDACSHPLDCAADRFCDLPAAWAPGVWGTCRPLRANGWACAGDLQCASATCGVGGTCTDADPKDLCLTRLYASDVATDAPLAYYRLGEPSGASAEDASKHDHPGDRSGDPDAIYPGALALDPDRAAHFDGKDDAITVASTLLEGAAGFGVECWLAPDDKVPAPVLTLAGETLLAIGPSGDTLVADLRDTDGYSHPLTSGAGVVTPHQWAHVVVTYDGAHGALFVDGKKAAAFSSVFTPAVAGPLAMGVAATGVEHFAGGLDEVAIYGAALPAARVASHRRVAIAGPVVARWRFFTWLE